MSPSPRYWSIDSVYHRLTGTNHPEVHFGKGDARVYVDYLQPKGKTVLDVGAFVGDSARVFVEAGAKKVLCVEKEERFARQISLDRCQVLNEAFDPEKHLLGLEWDACKIDVEGYEALALPYLRWIYKPIVVEVHSAYLRDLFARQGFGVVQGPTKPRQLWVGLMGRGGVRNRLMSAQKKDESESRIKLDAEIRPTGRAISSPTAIFAEGALFAVYHFFNHGFYRVRPPSGLMRRPLKKKAL